MEQRCANDELILSGWLLSMVSNEERERSFRKVVRNTFCKRRKSFTAIRTRENFVFYIMVEFRLGLRGCCYRFLAATNDWIFQTSIFKAIFEPEIIDVFRQPGLPVLVTTLPKFQKALVINRFLVVILYGDLSSDGYTQVGANMEKPC